MWVFIDVGSAEAKEKVKMVRTLEPCRIYFTYWLIPIRSSQWTCQMFDLIDPRLSRSKKKKKKKKKKHTQKKKHFYDKSLPVLQLQNVQCCQIVKIKKNLKFSYFCSKHRLWILVNIYCGYLLEPPRFLSRNSKNNVCPCKPHFTILKWGWRGSKLYRHVFVMGILYLNDMPYTAGRAPLLKIDCFFVNIQWKCP